MLSASWLKLFKSSSLIKYWLSDLIIVAVSDSRVELDL